MRPGRPYLRDGRERTARQDAVDATFDLLPACPTEHEHAPRGGPRRWPRTRSPRAPPRSTRPASSPGTSTTRSSQADFHAVHVPEEYGGAGRRRARHLHRHRGGRPGLRVVLADPGGEQARHDAAAAVGVRGAQAALPAGGRQRRGDVLLRAVRAGGRAATRRRCAPRAVRDGDDCVLNGAKRWITNAGVSTYYTVMAVTDPDAGRDGISAFVVEKPTTGFIVRAPRRTSSGIKGSPTRELYFDNCRDPGRPAWSASRGHRLQDRAAHPRPHPGHHRARRRSASRRARSTTPSATSRSASSSASRSREFQGMQFMLADMAMKLEAARQLTYVAPRPRPSAATRT